MDGVGTDETGGARRRVRAVWGLIFCTLFWGATFNLMKSGSAEIAKNLPAADRAWAPLLFLAARFALASLAFPFVFPRLCRGARESIRWGVIAGIPFTVGFILQIYGLRDVTPSISALFTSMFVVFTPLLGRVLFGKRTSAAVALAIACAVIGLWLVTGADKSGVPHFGLGEWLSLLCALVFSFQIHATDVGTKKCDPIGLAWHQVTFAAIACALPILLLRPSVFAVMPAALHHRDIWLGIGFTAIFATVGSMALMSHFQRFLSPNHAAVVYTLEPLFTAIFSAILISERFGAAKLVGGGLILAGNLACGVRGSPEESPKEPGQAAT